MRNDCDVGILIVCCVSIDYGCASVVNVFLILSVLNVNAIDLVIVFGCDAAAAAQRPFFLWTIKCQ